MLKNLALAFTLAALAGCAELPLAALLQPLGQPEKMVASTPLGPGELPGGRQGSEQGQKADASFVIKRDPTATATWSAPQ